MKKFAFLILSLALAFGCQPAEDTGGDSGDATPAESTDTGSDDSAAVGTDEATKQVALKITSKLR